MKLFIKQFKWKIIKIREKYIYRDPIDVPDEEWNPSTSLDDANNNSSGGLDAEIEAEDDLCKNNSGNAELGCATEDGLTGEVYEDVEEPTDEVVEDSTVEE